MAGVDYNISVVKSFRWWCVLDHHERQWTTPRKQMCDAAADITACMVASGSFAGIGQSRQYMPTRTEHTTMGPEGREREMVFEDEDGNLRVV